MAKRFIDGAIWTQNQWFRCLRLETKLFWFYIITTCDSVGVWEEDFDLVSYIIGSPITKEEVYADLNGKILVMSQKKIWIKDFCDFQYGELIEENIANKPHQSYIKLLKKHNLWETYQNPMDDLIDAFNRSHP
jgi:hypothetical protein